MGLDTAGSMPPTLTVSIVTPTLNQARFLPAALRSVQAQTYPVAEHIVIDGGSTDATLDVLRGAEAAGGVRWTSGPDGGMYEAVNKGLAMAGGDVLAYLPSDDAYLPWAVETIVRAFARSPSLDLVYGDGVTIETDSGTQILRLYAAFDRIGLANYASLLQPAVFWRRRLYEQVGGFDTSMRFVADLDYWLRAAAEGARIAHVDEVLALERVHEDRLSSARREAMKAEDIAMRARHGASPAGSAAHQLAARRFIRRQRWLWLRFVVASTLRPLPGPWRRFLRDGEVMVHRRRALRGIRNRRHNLWRGAIESALAARILSTEAA